MRLLAGFSTDTNASSDASSGAAQTSWAGVEAGAWLDEVLAELRDPAASAEGAAVPGLQAELRPYQATGVEWLWFISRLGLGGCLADDMGLGKTIQTLGLLLKRKAASTDKSPSSLLVLPASLLANWRDEIRKFAPSLSFVILHPSEPQDITQQASSKACLAADVVITTYGMLTRLEVLQTRTWDLVILDEAQAIKNPGTRQARCVKGLKAAARFALTGTPVENRAGDLWSLFDFINPGLLGSAPEFSRFTKARESAERPDYAPLRNLTRPYILRRLKTDKRIIQDLPEKTEVRAWCSLSKAQAALYQRAVTELAEALDSSDGIQ
ncbi:MAG: SNF2-related protein, partial [Verrucomicrobiales bacterium]